MIGSPPEELLHAPARRIVRALVLPFGEAVSSEHDDAGRTYRWGEVRLPRSDVPLDLDHDGSRLVGFASFFVQDRRAIWCSIKLGHEGLRLLRSGYHSLSAEIDEGGEVVALSLCVKGRPAFASAGIYDAPEEVPSSSETPFLQSEVPFLEGRYKSTVLWGGWVKPSPPPSEFRALDPLIRDDNPPDPEAEAARLRAWYEDRVRSIREAEENQRDPWRWFRETAARHKAEWEAQQAREYETEREVQRLRFELAAAAIPPPRPRRRWTRWVAKLGVRIRSVGSGARGDGGGGVSVGSPGAGGPEVPRTAEDTRPPVTQRSRFFPARTKSASRQEPRAPAVPGGSA